MTADPPSQIDAELGNCVLNHPGSGVTVIVPVALTVPQPPVNGMS